LAPSWTLFGHQLVLDKHIVCDILLPIMSKNYIMQIEELLKVGKFSQMELAGELGISYAALSRWINGHAKPHPGRLVAIEKLYQEIVGYPAVTEKCLKEVIKKANLYKVKGIWKTIEDNGDLQNEFLLEHTYNSTSIEGTTFTKRETEGVIFTGAVIHDKTLKEHIEVTNHATVLRNVFDRKYTGPISEEFIKHLHENLMQGLHKDAGSYSKHERVIRGLDISLTHPKDILEEMKNLVSNWNKDLSRKTIRDIADFHISFELIHPFGDGNGRLGRILMVLQCLKYGYPPVVIENVRKTEYYDVLQYAQTKADGPFVCFLVSEMERTDKILKKYRTRPVKRAYFF
jgi:Fic family protein